MKWDVQTRDIEFTCPALPEMVGRGPGGKAFSEPMLIARSIRGREAVGELFEYVVVAESQPGFLQNPADAAQIDLEPIIGLHGTVAIQLAGIGTSFMGEQGEIGRANVGADTRYISGEIVSARIRCVEDRAAVYEFVLRPFVWQATQNCDSRIFSGSVMDVLRDVLAKYVGTIEWRIGGPWGGKAYYPPRDMVRQAWESDWTFALRLMEEWGLVFWFEHRKDFHSLVISDTSGGFERHGVAYEALRYHTGSRIDEEHIGELAVTYTATAGRATVNDHNYMRPRLGKGRVASREEHEDTSGTANGEIEIYAPAEFAQPETRSTTEQHDMHEEGRHLARVKLQAARCKGLRAKGKGHLRGLEPGRTFTLANYPQAAANREYVVLACELDMTEVGTSTVGTSADARRTYAVNAEFELHPVGEPYRLPQITPKPRVEGYEYAVIVAPQDHEMWTDYRNRLLIQFDWDREARFDGARSIWVRVVTQAQGREMGVVTPGRAGQMVVVSHVHGDPDRPVVAGFVVDSDNLPPWQLPANAALSGMRSRRLEHGAESNHLALDDTPGKQQAQLASDHAKSSLSLGFITRIDGNKGRQDARGEGFELRTDRWGVLRAARGLLATTFSRPNAAGQAKDVSETHARLTEARGIHEDMAQLAQRHGAQSAADNQGDVSKALKDANAALRGQAAANSDDFPELANPDIAISSAANVHLSATASMHIASREHTALTSGGSVAIAALKSLYASIGGRIALFASKAITILTPGRVRVESQTDEIELIARKVINILSQEKEIRLTAQRILMRAGDTLFELGPNGIFGHTKGALLFRAASRAMHGPLNVPVRAPMTDLALAKVAEHFVLVDNRSGLRIAEQPYRVTLTDGQVITGTTSAIGETALVLAQTMQMATVEILHNDGSGNAAAILQPMMTQSAERVGHSEGSPEMAFEKRAVQSHRIGSSTLQANGDQPSTSGFDIHYALCSPYNWGMRYSKANENRPGQLEFPEARKFAVAIREVLLDEVLWGDNYYGGQGKRPSLQLTLPLETDSCKKLAGLLLSVIKSALTDPSSGSFAIPETCAPNVIVSAKPLPNNDAGTFDPASWTLSVSGPAMLLLFETRSKETLEAGVTDAVAKLTDFVNTIYHETRHCQQWFWMFAMMQQQAANFSGTPDIARLPAEVAKNGTAPDVVNIASSQKIPDDNLALTGIKRMTAGAYLFVLYKYYRENIRPSYISDSISFSSEYTSARQQAKELLSDAGAGGTPIDVDRMLADGIGQGYLSRPWEDDAFFCGELAGIYWTGNEPQNIADNQCSRKYALAYNASRLASIAGQQSTPHDEKK
ncbi:type VI secretion system tip protein VgrG [Paraburkholderia sp. Ac-20336]|uniref:type VI secretion system Vgr family protein n=1 Tax=Paraburkholderia sp. Ac-20336 TaxID=2703886 RepID=UPI00197D0E9F|nr:type VI secretion system Vgr family protein [Paraburkholderia sp. Ac-20336]MBN3805575.1 type VI secretion system tip protein VgrG [Paraburkholderia sp. Ac-20336]